MERDKLDFGNGKISSLFRAMFFPTLIGMAFNSALNICDGMFCGAWSWERCSCCYQYCGSAVSDMRRVGPDVWNRGVSDRRNPTG